MSCHCKNQDGTLSQICTGQCVSDSVYIKIEELKANAMLTQMKEAIDFIKSDVKQIENNSYKRGFDIGFDLGFDKGFYKGRDEDYE